MGNRVAYKPFIYFLSVFLLFLTSGFHMMVLEAKEVNRPIGEMFSSGEVKFESRENVWKNVEPSHFPIFQGVKIKTEKGDSAVTLSNDSQIEVKQNSLFFFDRNDQIHLLHGAINFRFPSTAELTVNAGNLTVMKHRSLPASRNLSAVQENGDTIGSISIRPNGAVTVKCLQGSLSVVNQDHVVVASLSSKDTVIIPSVVTKNPSKAMVAQAGDTTSSSEDDDDDDWRRREGFVFWGLPTETWVALGIGVFDVTAVGVAIGIVERPHGHGGHNEPICP